jgi:hypothetical protein
MLNTVVAHNKQKRKENVSDREVLTFLLKKLIGDFNIVENVEFIQTPKCRLYFSEKGNLVRIYDKPAIY